MIRSVLVLGMVALGLTGCEATSRNRPESAASGWAQWESAEVAIGAPDRTTLSAGDAMGVALYQGESPVAALPMD